MKLFIKFILILAGLAEGYKYMKKLLFEFFNVVANIHDNIIAQTQSVFNDKEMHFIIFGVLGLIVFIMLRWFFKHASYTLAAISTSIFVVLVMAVAVEVGQKITNTGNLETMDAVVGVIGALVFIIMFAILIFIIESLLKLVHKRKEKDQIDIDK